MSILADLSITTERVGAFFAAGEHLTGVPATSMLRQGRSPKIVQARRAMYLAFHADGESASEIGRIMGRDHTTVLAGISRATGGDTDLGRRIRDLACDAPASPADEILRLRAVITQMGDGAARICDVAYQQHVRDIAARIVDVAQREGTKP